jgi:hypothetical protein
MLIYVLVGYDQLFERQLFLTCANSLPAASRLLKHMQTVARLFRYVVRVAQQVNRIINALTQTQIKMTKVWSISV